jgi:hypothetical protein
VAILTNVMNKDHFGAFPFTANITGTIKFVWLFIIGGCHTLPLPKALEPEEQYLGLGFVA